MVPDAINPSIPIAAHTLDAVLGTPRWDELLVADPRFDIGNGLYCAFGLTARAHLPTGGNFEIVPWYSYGEGQEYVGVWLDQNREISAQIGAHHSLIASTFAGEVEPNEYDEDQTVQWQRWLRYRISDRDFRGRYPEAEGAQS